MKNNQSIRNSSAVLGVSDNSRGSMMKQANLSKIALSVAMTTTLMACGGGGSDDPVVTDVPVTPSITVAELGGSAIKGTLANADVEIVALNGTSMSVPAAPSTDENGGIFVELTAEPGFGIDTLVKMTVTANSASTMVCDAPVCGSVNQGGQVSGNAIAGTQLTTLGYLAVPFANVADGQVDANMQASALTTLSTKLIEAAIADGRNVSTPELLVLAQQEYSALLLRAMGWLNRSNVFTNAIVSAESRANFVASSQVVMVESLDDEGNPILLFDEEGNPVYVLDEEGNPVALLDEDGNPVVDEQGNPVYQQAVQMEEQINETLVDDTVRNLSLLNAAFSQYSEGFTQQGALDTAYANLTAALAGNPDALSAFRQPLYDALEANSVVVDLGLTADQLIDLELPLFDQALSSGPVKEITTDVNIATATITARNRISDGEDESKAFDGDVNTKWLDHNDWAGAPTLEDPSWIQIAFAQPEAVNSLFITSANDSPARDPENFDVLASNDGENWVTLAQFVGATFDERFERQEFRFANGLTYTHYRINITKNKGNDGLMQLSEIELVGPIYTSVDHSDPVGTGTITARNRIGDNEDESKAFDNDATTKWLDHNDWAGAPTAEDPSWIQMEFLDPVAVDTLAITSANDSPARDPENFALLGSNDGGLTWTTLNEWVGESFDERFERKMFSFGNQLGYRMYRLNISKNKGNDGLMQLSEIELIGPTVSGERHSHQPDVTYLARNRISDNESEDKAFDSDPNTKWLDHNDWAGAPTVDDPSWVQVTLPQAKAVNSLAITSANDAPERDPENFYLEGSFDGENWVRLAEWVGESFDERFQRREWQFSNSLAYPMYQLSITKNQNNDGLMQVGEIELIGPQYSAVDHSENDGVVITARNRIGDAEDETKAFDNDVNTKWLDHNDWAGAPTVENPSWIQIDLPEPEIVDALSITSANDAPERDPENFEILGSNDGGATWTVIQSWVGESFDDRFQRRVFSFGNGFAYTSYRLSISKNKNNDGLMQIAELEFIGPASSEPEVQ